MSILRTDWFTAFAVVVAASSCFAQVAPEPGEAAVVAELKAIGVLITIGPNGRVEEVEWNGDDEHKFTDSHLKSVAKLSELKYLWLHHSSVTDAGLAELSALKKLETLGLTCDYRYNAPANITDAGVVHLKRLTSLKMLRIEDGDITDAGLVGIGTMVGLEDLDLFGTEISDAGLPHLRKLVKLKYLNVGECQWEKTYGSITAAAAGPEKYLPKCDIDY